MLKTHKQRIQKGDEEHTKLPSAPDYTVFETSSFVLLDLVSGTAKNRLNSRRTEPFLVLDHVDSILNPTRSIHKKWQLMMMKHSLLRAYYRINVTKLKKPVSHL